MFSFNNAEQAGHWFTIYSWAIFFGAFVVAFATVGANLAGSAKDRFADYRIAAGEQATERAKTDAAIALERAANLQKEAEVARLETERVKRIVSWRFVTEEQSQKLKEALVEYRAIIVNLLWVDGDPEVQYFAKEIGNALSNAGWNVFEHAVTTQGELVYSVVIPWGGGDGRSANALRDAFKNAGIECHAFELPRGIRPVGSGSTFKNAEVTVLIGSKSPLTIR
jgi:hypothetical protein